MNRYFSLFLIIISFLFTGPSHSMLIFRDNEEKSMSHDSWFAAKKRTHSAVLLGGASERDIVSKKW
jgi:hypothetical protein